MENPFDLTKNPNAIVIQQDEDGNWRGWMIKNGKIIEERQYDPVIVLQALLTKE